MQFQRRIHSKCHKKIKCMEEWRSIGGFKFHQRLWISTFLFYWFQRVHTNSADNHLPFWERYSLGKKYEDRLSADFSWLSDMSNSERNTAKIETMSLLPLMKAQIHLLKIFQKHQCDMNFYEGEIKWLSYHGCEKERNWNPPVCHSQKVMSSKIGNVLSPLGWQQ